MRGPGGCDAVDGAAGAAGIRAGVDAKAGVVAAETGAEGKPGVTGLDWLGSDGKSSADVVKGGPLLQVEVCGGGAGLKTTLGRPDGTVASDSAHVVVPVLLDICDN